MGMTTLNAHLSAFLPVYLSVYLTIWLTIWLSGCLSGCPSVDMYLESISTCRPSSRQSNVNLHTLHHHNSAQRRGSAHNGLPACLLLFSAPARRRGGGRGRQLLASVVKIRSRESRGFACSPGPAPLT